MKILLSLFLLTTLTNTHLTHINRHKNKRIRKHRKLNQPKKQCNPKILESYDLEYTPNTIEPNILCPSITQNCCTLKNQSKMYKKWVVGHERVRILNVYKDFFSVYKNIFENFSKIEEFAKRIHFKDISSPSNCNKFAKSIIGININVVKENFLEVCKKNFQFFYESRRGFYCGICDAERHEFFDGDKEEVMMSYGFCRKMVGESLGFYNFKYLHFMKISRVFSQFMESCSLMGKYSPQKFIKHAKKFFRDEEIYNDINKCKDSLDTPKGYTGCLNFCERFNPAKFDKYLEGELGKLYTYNHDLELKMSEKEKIYKEQNKKHELANRRLLEEESPKKPEEPSTPKEGEVALEEEEPKKIIHNEFNEFNKEFKTSIIKPITYQYKEDLLSNHYINFNQSLFGLNLKAEIDVSEFKSVFGPKGLNFYNYGFSALFNPEGLDVLIKNLAGVNKPAEKGGEKKEGEEAQKEEEGGEGDKKEGEAEGEADAEAEGEEEPAE